MKSDKITHFSLNDITFPIYRLRGNLGIRDDSKVTYITNTYGKEQILDNKNLRGDTLGKRRLRISKEDIYPLNKMTSKVEVLINYPGSTFIDSKGLIFKYQKGTVWGKIEYKQIIKVINREASYPLIYVKGIPYPFEVGNYTNLYKQYVGLLNYKGGHLVYELCAEKKRDRRIRI